MIRELHARLLTLRSRLPVELVVLMAAGVAVVIGLVQKYPCNNGHPAPDVGWTRVCYSDVLPLYSVRKLNEGSMPYLQTPVEYPVLIGLTMAVIGLPVHWLGSTGRLLRPAHALGFETVDEGVVNFWATVAVNAVLVIVTTRLLLKLRKDRPRDVLLWALAPPMMLAFTVNWDMLAVTPAVGALLAWSRGKPGLAGALIGIGTAAKLFPVLLLVPIVLLCLRERTAAGRWVALRVVGWAVAVWTALNLPFAIANTSAWWYSYKFSQERWVDWGTLYYLADHVTTGLGGHDAVMSAIGTVPHLNRTTEVAFGLAMVAVAALIWWAPQPPRVAAMAFLVVAVFLLTNKVWSQQFVLWLLPLAVLARPRRTSLPVWHAIEVVYLISFMRVVIGQKDDYALVMAGLARYVAVGTLVVLVVVDALRPERDPLRGPDLSDPDAGALAPAAEAEPVGPPEPEPELLGAPA